VIKLQKKNLKKPLKHTTYYQILRENKVMIILVMLHLKMALEEEEDLETLISLVISQISSKTSLAKVLEVEEEDQEDQTIEDQI
jgi:hypothetical protein